MMASLGVYQADRLAGAEWVSVQRFWVSLPGELKPALRRLCLQAAFSDRVCIFRLIFGFVEAAFRPALFQICLEELFELVKRNLAACIVVQIRVARARHDVQLLVWAAQRFERVFAEVAGMRLFTMHD